MRNLWTLNDLGCLLGVLALAAFLPLAILGRHLFQSIAAPSTSYAFVGWTCLTIYGLTALLNFYLSCIRPSWHARRRSGEYKHVSGIPIVHSLFLLAATVTLPPSIPAGMLMLLLLGLDTGAAHWAAFAMATEFLVKRG